jgi:hypothetical protein
VVLAKAALILALAASLVAGLQTWRVGYLTDRLAEAERAFGICDATLTAYLEGDDIDADIPDDLDDYVPPDRWMREGGEFSGPAGAP